MRLLLDTHILLWSLEAPNRLTAQERVALVTDRNDVVVSAVSLWEVVIKRSLGKLDTSADLPAAMREQGYVELPVSFRHALGVAELPLLHGDPFDRLLVAQARTERLVLVTRDRLVRQYDVEVL